MNKRLFLFLSLIFWTHPAFSQENDRKTSQEEALKPITVETSPSTEGQSQTDNSIEQEEEIENLEKTLVDILGFKKRHSLIYGSFGSGWAQGALTGKTSIFELGYERPYNINTKLGFYLAQSKVNYSEYFYFNNTGYYENRNNEVTVQVLGLQARYGLLRYIDLRAGLGLSTTTMAVKSVETDSPAPSTALGFSDTYPLGVNFRLGLSATKTFNTVGLAFELAHEETALGMSHSVSSNTFNIIVRYFYNRARVKEPDLLEDSNSSRQNESRPVTPSPYF